MALGLGEIQGALEAAAFGVDFLLKLEDGVEESFGARRAAGDVNVNRNYLVYALHDGVIIEDAAGGGTGAHRDGPLGFGHLRVELLDHRSHFLRDASGDDHQIGLAWRTAKNFGAEARNIVAG